MDADIHKCKWKDPNCTLFTRYPQKVTKGTPRKIKNYTSYKQQRLCLWIKLLTGC